MRLFIFRLSLIFLRLKVWLNSDHLAACCFCSASRLAQSNISITRYYAMKTFVDGHRGGSLRAMWLCLPLAVSAPALSQSVPPPSTSSAAPMTAAGGLSVSPKNGQTADQQAADRYACYTWAVKESKWDPATQHGSAAGLATYQRAMTACLEGRGYSVTPAAAPSPAAPPAPASVGTRTTLYAASSPPELKYRPFEVQ